MKRITVVLVLVMMVVFATHTYAQLQRNSQFEVYGGIGIPLGPEDFKEYYKMGISLNVQYVFFPSPRLGIPIFAGYEHFTVDSDPINQLFGDMLRAELAFEGLDLMSYDLDVEGSGSGVKLGIGVRPYLTPIEASTQFFLFANATYNMLTTKLKANSGTVTAQDYLGNVYDVSFTEEELGEAGEFSEDENKFGLGGGAGVEIPAGDTFNLILQGMFNIIFTEVENTTFLGITAGLVF